MAVAIQNEEIITFPVDVKVAVLNKNSQASVLRFDGYDHEFPPGEATILDCETAFALFAVDTRTPPGHAIKLRRDKAFGRAGTSNSFYDECLVKYGAANTQNGRQWFENFDFKLVKTQKKLSSMDFEKIK